MQIAKTEYRKQVQEETAAKAKLSAPMTPDFLAADPTFLDSLIANAKQIIADPREELTEVAADIASNMAAAVSAYVPSRRNFMDLLEEAPSMMDDSAFHSEFIEMKQSLAEFLSSHSDDDKTGNPEATLIAPLVGGPMLLGTSASVPIPCSQTITELVAIIESLESAIRRFRVSEHDTVPEGILPPLRRRLSRRHTPPEPIPRTQELLQKLETQMARFSRKATTSPQTGLMRLAAEIDLERNPDSRVTSPRDNMFSSRTNEPAPKRAQGRRSNLPTLMSESSSSSLPTSMSDRSSSNLPTNMSERSSRNLPKHMSESSSGSLPTGMSESSRSNVPAKKAQPSTSNEHAIMSEPSSGNVFTNMAQRNHSTASTPNSNANEFPHKSVSNSVSERSSSNNVGSEISSEANSRIGSRVGSNVGSNVDSNVGSNVGSNVNSETSLKAGSKVSLPTNRNVEQTANSPNPTDTDNMSKSMFDDATESRRYHRKHGSAKTTDIQSSSIRSPVHARRQYCENCSRLISHRDLPDMFAEEESFKWKICGRCILEMFPSSNSTGGLIGTESGEVLFELSGTAPIPIKWLEANHTFISAKHLAMYLLGDSKKILLAVETEEDLQFIANEPDLFIQDELSQDQSSSVVRTILQAQIEQHPMLAKLLSNIGSVHYPNPPSIFPDNMDQIWMEFADQLKAKNFSSITSN